MTNRETKSEQDKQSDSLPELSEIKASIASSLAKLKGAQSLSNNFNDSNETENLREKVLPLFQKALATIDEQTKLSQQILKIKLEQQQRGSRGETDFFGKDIAMSVENLTAIEKKMRETSAELKVLIAEIHKLAPTLGKSFGMQRGESQSSESAGAEDQ